jgi:hypothetical protein
VIICRQIVKYPMMTAANQKTFLPELEEISERSMRRAILKDLKCPAVVRPRNLSSLQE